MQIAALGWPNIVMLGGWTQSQTAAKVFWSFRQTSRFSTAGAPNVSC
jgi:hypothetical protein